MRIGVIGLGLIGGSLAKTIKKNTNYPCFGYDKDKSVIEEAIKQEAIDGSLSLSRLSDFDMLILGLYPDVTIDFINNNINNMKKGTIIIDTCGVKQAVVDAVDKLCFDNGIHFVGCHPMAGREFSGFSYSLDNLFEKASFIITSTQYTNKEAMKKVETFALEIGFLKCTESTPKEHDSVIAFTSQLAHIVSSAYVKSPSLLKQEVFSAGSFKDLTRVAKLNPEMWTTLFLMNKNSLVSEIDYIIEHLTEYRNAINSSDEKELYSLLKDGTELKEKSNSLNVTEE